MTIHEFSSAVVGENRYREPADLARCQTVLRSARGEPLCKHFSADSSAGEPKVTYFRAEEVLCETAARAHQVIGELVNSRDAYSVCLTNAAMLPAARQHQSTGGIIRRAYIASKAGPAGLQQYSLKQIQFGDLDHLPLRLGEHAVRDWPAIRERIVSGLKSALGQNVAIGLYPSASCGLGKTTEISVRIVFYLARHRKHADKPAP